MLEKSEVADPSVIVTIPAIAAKVNAPEVKLIDLYHNRIVVVVNLEAPLMSYTMPVSEAPVEVAPLPGSPMLSPTFGM